ncbi:hypothetical protein T265_05220 [Opisthorchis viverrini]|uniref:Uncharacterized protein n=1 Tax=Opisthorchis viverrini TaxID=6198 RepID=A0A074ZPQ8_OPIVI|nr:hypothetical protein T265_05220 [Opisthorchis viverrini]KER27792.1 hypothetical protein T265_05220 [Opisthorchis viverrini]
MCTNFRPLSYLVGGLSCSMSLSRFKATGARSLKWLEHKFADQKVRGSNPTSASRLPLSRPGRPGSIPALVLPSGSMAVRHRKGVTAERFKATVQPRPDSALPATSYQSIDSLTYTKISDAHSLAPFRYLAAMPPEGSTRAGILPGCPSLDRESREAEVGFEPRTFRSVNSRSNHLGHLASFSQTTNWSHQFLVLQTAFYEEPADQVRSCKKSLEAVSSRLLPSWKANHLINRTVLMLCLYTRPIVSVSGGDFVLILSKTRVSPCFIQVLTVPTASVFDPSMGSSSCFLVEQKNSL